MKHLSIFVLMILFSGGLFSQAKGDYCGTHTVSPWFDHYSSNPSAYDIEWPEEPIYIPLTVHVLGTDAGTGYFLKSQVFDAFCRLNEDFAATNMQFFMDGEINYINNTTWYNHEEYPDGYDMMNSNNVPGTVNCYIVQNPAGNCGYYAPAGDAVALSKGCMSPNDHTWAHELGHFFSLPHTFRGWEGIEYDPNVPTRDYRSQNRRGIENVARDNCTTSADRFCDTPADYLSYRWPCDNQGQSLVTQTDPNGETFRSDGTLFMSYASDNCSSRFSTQQVNAMLANLNSQRRELLNNEAYDGEILEGPVALSPQDDEALQFDDATLIWSKVENATHYHIQASRLPNLGGLLIADEIVTDTAYQLPELTLGNTYYWRVRAYNKFEFCTNPTERFSFVASALTSSTDLETSDKISVWPNPVQGQSGRFVIDGLDKTINGYDWRLMDISGKIIQEGLLDNSHEIQLTNQQKHGTYTLVVSSQAGQFVTRVVITR